MPDARATLTVQEHGTRKLARLCEAIGFGQSDHQLAQKLFASFAGTWARGPLAAGPQWASDVTDDSSPYEFSLAFDGSRCELRFLVEAHVWPMTVQSGWAAALGASDALHREFGVPLDRLKLVQDLFEPSDTAARFTLWHAVCLRPSEPPDIKIYFNPNVHGPHAARDLLERALSRLDMRDVWTYLSTTVLQPRDVLAYFSLDLSAEPHARVKVYLAHPGLTAAQAEQLMATDGEFTPGLATRFCRRILATEGPLEQRPAGTCFAFIHGHDGPFTTTLHLPVRAYAENDQVIADRILDFIAPAQHETFTAALRAIAERPLADGVGIIQWVSIRQRHRQNRITAYLAPEAYRQGYRP